MPIHDLGYRSWTGSKTPPLLRFWIIAKNGIQVVLRNRWIRRGLYGAWLPTLFFAGCFFAYEQFIERMGGPESLSGFENTFLGGFASATGDFDTVSEAMNTDDIAHSRHIIWSWLLSTSLQYPQAIWAMLIIGMIAPPLIAKDVRTRAFLLYFSRPINRYEYVFGKMVIVGSFLLFITAGPSIACYIIGVCLSSDSNAVLHTWDLPFRIVIASFIFVIPAVSISLMFSSLTAESRFAAFSWFAVWGLGAVAWSVMFGVLTDESRRRIYFEYQERDQQLQAEFEAANREAFSENLGTEGDATSIPSANDSTDGAQSQPDSQDPNGLQDDQSLANDSTEIIVNGEVIVVPPDIPGPPRHEEYRVINVGGRTIVVNNANEELMRERAMRMNEEEKRIRNHPASLFSMYHTLVRLQRWVFGLESDYRIVLPALFLTSLATFGSWVILLRKVAAPIRI